MKISDILDVGGSFSEIVAADYDRGSITTRPRRPIPYRDRGWETDPTRHGAVSWEVGHRR